MKIKQILFLIFAFLVLILPINVFGTAQPIGPFYNDLVLEYGATGLEVKPPLSAAYGGTGVVNNVLNTITFTGDYTLGLTLTANTTITLPISGTILTSSSKLSDLAATTSAELITVISDETGSGLLVFGTSPNITTPTGIVKGDVGLGNVENLKIKLDATAAPTVNDDVDLGYSVGSTWVDITNDKGYICLDNTDGAAVWTEVTLAGSGYTNLTSFVDQTAWRVFYSNADGDVIELALGVDGTYLRSNGATSAPTFGTPTGAGDMLKATYDTDTDNIVDKAETVDDGVGNSSTAIDVKDAVTKKHSQNTDTQFDFYNALSSDHTWSGDKDTQPVGESVVFGDLLYFNWATVIGTDIAFVDGGAGEDTITQVAARFLEIGLVAGDVITVTGSTSNNGNFTIISVVAGTINVATASLVAEAAGASVTITSPHEWKKAKADAFGTAKATRIALETKANGETCLMLVKGYLRDDSAFDFGASRIFLNDDTAGTCDDIAPAESGDQIFVVGEAKSADILFFNPSQDVGEI